MKDRKWILFVNIVSKILGEMIKLGIRCWVGGGADGARFVVSFWAKILLAGGLLPSE